MRRPDDVPCGLADEPRPPKIQIQIDEDIAQGAYSNLVLINHSDSEFVLDFAFLQPGSGRAKVRARLVSSPKHTKRLLTALQKNLDRYEARYGVIEMPEPDPSDPTDDGGPAVH